MRLLNFHLYATTRLFAVVASALHGACSHPDPTHVTMGVHSLAGDALDRFKAELGEEVAHV